MKHEKHEITYSMCLIHQEMDAKLFASSAMSFIVFLSLFLGSRKESWSRQLLLNGNLDNDFETMVSYCDTS